MSTRHLLLGLVVFNLCSFMWFFLNQHNIYSDQNDISILPQSNERRSLRDELAQLQHHLHAAPQRNKQTLVLPIGPDDLDRFQNLYKSLKKFFDFSDVEEFVIITPTDADGVRRIREIALEHQNLIKIISDSELLPALVSLPTTNWMTQQLLKLAVATIVRTEFYLVLDADLICFKPTSFTDLIVNGKAVTNMYNTPTQVHLEHWWTSTQKVLDLTMDSSMYFGVTPAILATKVVIGLHRHIEAVHHKPWDQFLLENVYNYTFTEFCLYAVFAIASGEFPKYHVARTNGVYNSERSMWFESEFDSIDVPHMVEYGHFYSGHFIVLQSNTKIAADRIRAKLGTTFD